MKNIYFIVLFGLIILFACEVDNYDEPSIHLTGKFQYNGQKVNIRQMKEPQSFLELFEWIKKVENGGNVVWKWSTVPIRIYTDQNGNYSSLLYPSTYKFVHKPNLMPWKTDFDTIVINLESDKKMNFDVVPYFDFSNHSFTLSQDTAMIYSLTANFTIQKVYDTTGVNATRAQLVVGKTTLVDINIPKVYKKSTSNPAVGTPITLIIPLNDGSKFTLDYRDYIYARLALLTSAGTEYYYTSPEKILIK